MVQLTVSLPDRDYGHMGHVEIFARDDLMSTTTWIEGDCWIPTLGRAVICWADPLSSYKPQRFYCVSDGTDSDGDGRSDLYEAWVGHTASNVFNAVNADGDDLHDWLEMKVFGSLAQTGADDFDRDGLLNGEELISGSPDLPAVMISNPALADSDGEGISDFDELRVWNTDAMDPDTDCDGRDDASEVLGSPPTDPCNPDTIAPVVILAGG
jgi:hypothetical protein